MAKNTDLKVYPRGGKKNKKHQTETKHKKPWIKEQK